MQCQFKQMVWQSCNLRAVPFVTIHLRSCLACAVADWSLAVDAVGSGSVTTIDVTCLHVICDHFEPW